MVKHLPPAVKQLLSLRNPHAAPAPPLLALRKAFADTLSDARAQPSPAETGWLVLTTCTLLTVNTPSCVGHLYRFTTRTDPNDANTRTSVSEAVRKAALMRESALKSSIFVGVPRSILTLGALHEALEDDVKHDLRVHSLRHATPENVEALVGRGRALWDSIYEPHAQKLHDKLGAYHPDFISFIIQAYGSVLAPLPGGAAVQGNLSRTLSSVVGTACLRAEGGVGPQLTSHVFGLLKARSAEGQGVEDRWLSSDEGTEWVIRTVDAIVDALSPAPESGPQAKL